jgi:glycosyltransferase involved in cell wall biosynthesis
MTSPTRSERARQPPSEPASRPLVSILLPVRDAASTLPTCLDSLIRQRETRWECVAVDDGSRDDGLEVLHDYARSEPRFRILSVPHRGIVAALNLGLDACRAEFVARMDADDWMHRDRLSEQVQLLVRRPELSAVGCRVRLFPRTGMTDGRRAYEHWINQTAQLCTVRREAFIECPIAHPALMIRRSVLAEHRYREMGWPEDYDLLLRLLGAGHEMAVHPRRLLGWRDSPDRLSRTADTYGLDRFAECKAAHLAATFLADSDRYLLWGYGKTARLLRKALLAHGKSPSYIIELHPRRIGKTIHGAPVIRPEELSMLPRTPLIASVSGKGPRGEIRAFLTGMGLEEVRDFICAA